MREEVRVLCVKSAGLGREHCMPTRVFSFGLKGISKRRGDPHAAQALERPRPQVCGVVGHIRVCCQRARGRKGSKRCSCTPLGKKLSCG